jgi:hypothetical protein
MRDVGLVRSNRMSFNWVDNSVFRIQHSALAIGAPEQLKGEGG